MVKRSSMKIRSKRFVIQKYIEKPLLYHGKKFDIRQFMMVTHTGKVYWFREMYIRVSAYNYDLKDMKKFGHLNNIALQKYSKDYDGEKAVISAKTLESYIQSNLHSHFDFEEQIRKKIKQIMAIMSSFLIKKFKEMASTKKNFEIFGLDFMIDRDFRVWLIEANTNPAITTGNSFLDQLMPRMLDDAFKLTLDKLFQVPHNSSHVKNLYGKKTHQEMIRNYQETVFPLEDFPDLKNLWEKISNKQIEKALQSNPNE